jgi:hypothetical protein
MCGGRSWGPRRCPLRCPHFPADILKWTAREAPTISPSDPPCAPTPDPTPGWKNECSRRPPRPHPAMNLSILRWGQGWGRRGDVWGGSWGSPTCPFKDVHSFPPLILCSSPFFRSTNWWKRVSSQIRAVPGPGWTKAFCSAYQVVFSFWSSPAHQSFKCLSFFVRLRSDRRI